MKKFMKFLLAIVVALTFVSCATLGNNNVQKFSDTHQIADHSETYEHGWNYVFPYEEHSSLYIIVYYSHALSPLAVVCPIEFMIHPDKLEASDYGTWIWSVRYKTELNNGFEHGQVATAEEGVNIAEYTMERFLMI